MVTCVGAMLLEPLMGTILLITHSMVSADKQNLKSSGLGFLFQIAACLIASTLYFFVTPVKAPTEEILSFAQPTLFEVMAAFVGGIAGVIGYTRKDRINTIIPGVAIATALMLPLFNIPRCENMTDEKNSGHNHEHAHYCMCSCGMLTEIQYK